MPTLLTLPEEALLHILSYSLPRNECQIWEWIGIFNQTCRAFQPMTESFLPTSINLADFEHYHKIDGTSYSEYDARVSFMQSIHDYSWKRMKLKEFHWIWGSDGWMGNTMGETHESIRLLLQSLLTEPSSLPSFLTEPSSLPSLEWLDIELQSDNVDISTFHIIDAKTLRGIPTALPSLKRLCLCNCFKEEEIVGPYVLKTFFECMQTPLESLSLGNVEWMTDAHVEAFMPVVGRHLIRLELVDCMESIDELQDPMLLTDISASAIAESCTKLESFSMVNSDITISGLQRVISNNPKITTLNLSSNDGLDNNTVDVISRFLPRLRELRNYWANSSWLSDDRLISLINAQEKQNGSVCLNLIGLQSEDNLTIRGLEYAVKKGVKVIELDKNDDNEDSNRDLEAKVLELESDYDVKVWQAKYVYYIDGSLYERKCVRY